MQSARWFLREKEKEFIYERKALSCERDEETLLYVEFMSIYVLKLYERRIKMDNK